MQKTATDTDTMLTEDMVRFYADPLGFVLYAYDWGRGELAGFDGPDQWQRAFLDDIGRQVSERNFDGVNPVDPIRMATASGHGIGKSALTAWLVDWIMSTRPFAKGVVTANTFDQLQTKTWAEVAKWTKRCVTGHWFDVSSGGLWMRSKEHPETWRVDAQTCREENSESFAGLHAVSSTPFYIFDEASAVPDKIWEVAEGGTTDGEPMWYVFGNPTRNTGRFRECFGKFRNRWTTKSIDSRECKFPNKKLIEEWVESYGDDSDFVRVRVKGQFPRASSAQFIPSDVAEAASGREINPSNYEHAPIVIGVDVARFGSAQTVFVVRRGLAVLHMEKHRGKDTMWTSARASSLFDEYHADALFIDDTGVGGGVTDNLRLRNYAPIAVNAGNKATNEKRYYNKRVEMWGLMRDWLESGGCVPKDQELVDDLIGPEYYFDAKSRFQLEKKEDMEKRGIASPDSADALALTFAHPVVARGAMGGQRGGQQKYDMFSRGFGR